MPVPNVNNGQPPITYTDSFTCIFTFPKPSFSLNISNGAVYYKLAVPSQTGRAGDVAWDAAEHYLVPSLTNFISPRAEGFSDIDNFGGVMVRSATSSPLARITII